MRKTAGGLGAELYSRGGTGAGIADAPGNLYAVNGVTATPGVWPASPGERLASKERAAEPATLLRHYARTFLQLEGPDGWRDASPDPAISLLTALRNAAASKEAMRLVAADFNDNSLARMPQVGLVRIFAIFMNLPSRTSSEEVSPQAD